MRPIISLDQHWRLQAIGLQLCLRLSGDALVEVDEAFAQRVLACCSAEPWQCLVIDFVGCNNLSSSAMGFLVQVQRAAAAAGVPIRAQGVSGRVGNLLRVLGLDRLIELR